MAAKAKRKKKANKKDYTKKNPKIKSIHIPNKAAGVSEWMPPIAKNVLKVNSNSWFDILYHANPNPSEVVFDYNIMPIVPAESDASQKQKRARQLGSAKKYLEKQAEKWEQEFDINEINFGPEKPSDFIYTKKIAIYPTPEQETILDFWFDAFAKMFNVTINFIRKAIFKNGKLIPIKDARKIVVFEKVRNSLLKFKNTFLQETEPNPIPAHTLDAAIQQAVSNFNACITNYEAGRIKKFRIREWSYNRNRKIIKLEKTCFRKNTFCPTIFDFIKSSTPFNKVAATCTLQYNRITKKYILFVPTVLKEKFIKQPIIDCGIDLGVRTFATVYTKNATYEVCNRRYEKNYGLPVKTYDLDFKKYHKKIDTINRLLLLRRQGWKETIVYHRTRNKTMLELKKIPKTQNLKRALKKYHKRITDKVQDMHFKVAYQLVTRHNRIFIGKLSTLKILSKNNKTINRQTKRMIGVLAPSLFRQRLVYMGNKYGAEVSEVNEFLTTKTCSNCGRKKELGQSKKYICQCGMEADRDINSAKNILKVGLKARRDQMLEKAHKKNKKRKQPVTKKKVNAQKNKVKKPIIVKELVEV